MFCFAKPPEPMAPPVRQMNWSCCAPGEGVPPEFTQLDATGADRGRKEIAKALAEAVAATNSGCSTAPTEQGLSSSSSARAPVVLGFEEGSVSISRRPVDITFDYQSSPVTVFAVEGHGADLGVRVGWRLRTLDDLPAESDFAEFYSRFVERLNCLPGSYVLPLMFATLDGTYRTVLAQERPLGMGLVQSLPALVKESVGLAAELGIERGWSLVRVANKPVADFGDFNIFFAQLQKIVARLPERKVDSHIDEPG